MSKQYNPAKLNDGSWRSLRGYAAESLVIGEALLRGYNLFFKAWRDSPYDAVLDHNGNLFRIEIKGSSSGKFSATGGGRSGKQISRDVESREHIISPDDCEIAIALDTKPDSTNSCYLVPSEVLTIIDSKAPALSMLSLYKNKWGIFDGITELSTEDIAKGFMSRTTDDLKTICKRLNIPVTKPPLLQGENRTRKLKLTDKKRLAFNIWQHVFSKLEEV